MSLSRVADVKKTKSVPHVNIMPKMVLNAWSLIEVELLPFLAPNLYGFDPGLEAGSE